jgi:hypothetical protein
MKVKIFMDASASVIEEQINAWLDYLGSANIIKMETVVTAVAEKERSIGDRLQFVRVLSVVPGAATLRFDHHLMEGNMAASLTDVIRRSIQATAIAWLVGAAPACANVITDWDAKAIDAVAPLAGLPNSPEDAVHGIAIDCPQRVRHQLVAKLRIWMVDAESV